MKEVLGEQEMILAIDTASKTASVALVEQGGVAAEYSILSEKTHSRVILPMIEGMFSSAGKRPKDIRFIACAEGPGSFTGLRIGAAVAKGLAYTLNKKIVPVSSLDALAYNVFINGRTICPMIDARKGHVYTSFYRYEEGRLVRLSDRMTLPVKEAMNKAKKFGMPVLFVGGGASIYAALLKDADGSQVVPQHISRSGAGVLGAYALGVLGERHAVEGGVFIPVYMSRSQAEEDNGQ